MKHTPVAILRTTFGAWLMIAASPFAGAQTPAVSPAVSPPAAPAAAPAAAPDPDHMGYLFGLTFREQLRNLGITDQVTTESIVRGMKDAMKGTKSTQADQRTLQEYVRSQMLAAIPRNQAAAKEFLARNGREKGVTTTASGLEYKVIAPGDANAASPAPGDMVTVQYRGKLLDGTEFDSSYARGTPATFGVKGVIPGWQEALPLMKPGSKWQLFIPPELAYGATPKGGIPGGSLLIFDVELLSVKSTPPPAPAAAPPPPPRADSNPAPKSKSTDLSR